MSEQRAADALVLSLVLFVGGRFASTALLRWLPPGRLLRAQSLLAAAGCIGAMLGGAVGTAALCSVSLSMALCFP